MGGARGMHVGEQKFIYVGFRLGNLKERDDSENLVLGGVFKFKVDLQKMELRAWIRFMWLRTWIYGEMF
jgi:hypothetical protein